MNAVWISSLDSMRFMSSVSVSAGCDTSNGSLSKMAPVGADFAERGVRPDSDEGRATAAAPVCRPVFVLTLIPTGLRRGFLGF